MRVLCITVLAAFAVAAPSGASWSPDRATGAPDVAAAGDNVNAWAPMQANAGIEWLDLGFPKATKVARVRVRESFNPGALVRVTAWEAGREVDLWSGASVQKDGAVWFVVKPERSVLTDRVRLYLDTSKVAGWNEIDAVQLVGADGSGQWASRATASSTYATGASQDPLAAAIGKPVNVRTTTNHVVSGTVKRITAEWLELEQSGRTRLVNRAHAVDIEFE